MESLVQLSLKKVTLTSILASNILNQEIPALLMKQLEAIFTFENIIKEKLYHQFKDSKIGIRSCYLSRMIPEELINYYLEPKYSQREETLKYLYTKICQFFTHPGHITYTKGCRVSWEKRNNIYYLYEIIRVKDGFWDIDQYKITPYHTIDEVLRNTSVILALQDFASFFYLEELDDEFRIITNILLNGHEKELDEIWEKLKLHQITSRWSSEMAPHFLYNKKIIWFVIENLFWFASGDSSRDYHVYSRADGYFMLAWYLLTSERWRWEDHPFIQGQHNEEQIINPLQ